MLMKKADLVGLKSNGGGHGVDKSIYRADSCYGNGRERKKSQRFVMCTSKYTVASCCNQSTSVGFSLLCLCRRSLSLPNQNQLRILEH